MIDQLKSLSKEDREVVDLGVCEQRIQTFLLRALLTIDELEFKIAQAEPGSAAAIVHAVFDLAESECGHNPSSARHGLTTIRKWIMDAKARIHELEKDRDRWQKQAEEWDQYTHDLEEKCVRLESRQQKLVEALKLRKGCVNCKGQGYTERHQAGHTHYETDSECPPYHFERIPCECLREIGEGKAKND